MLAAQSMFYFKPPGARGQALHQDNFYLRVEPGTCVAAWIACDVIDRENGGLEVVPGTHRMDLFCPEEADAEVSFAREYVPPPPGLAAVPVDMSPGDVLFFNGSLVHGSQPNRTADRFRRSFIGHYVGRSAERIGSYYRTLTMSGDPVPLRGERGRGPVRHGVRAGGPPLSRGVLWRWGGSFPQPRPFPKLGAAPRPLGGGGFSFTGRPATTHPQPRHEVSPHPPGGGLGGRSPPGGGAAN